MSNTEGNSPPYDGINIVGMSCNRPLSGESVLKCRLCARNPRIGRALGQSLAILTSSSMVARTPPSRAGHRLQAWGLKLAWRCVRVNSVVPPGHF
jgi:hypothetical protein